MVAPERPGLDYGVGSDPSCLVFDEHAACVGARASQCMTLRYLPLHHRDRGKLGQDLHEVLLVGHHHIDVLVCAGCLVQVVGAAYALDDALVVKHPDLLLQRERTDRLLAAHQPARSVRRAHERLGTSESLDDV